VLQAAARTDRRVRKVLAEEVVVALSRITALFDRSPDVIISRRDLHEMTPPRGTLSLIERRPETGSSPLSPET